MQNFKASGMKLARESMIENFPLLLLKFIYLLFNEINFITILYLDYFTYNCFSSHSKLYFVHFMSINFQVTAEYSSKSCMKFLKTNSNSFIVYQHIFNVKTSISTNSIMYCRIFSLCLAIKNIKSRY